MTYALPTNITGIASFTQYIAQIEPNYFNYLLFSIWFITFIGLKGGSNITNGTGFTIASFVVFVIASFFQVLGIISADILWISLLATAAGLFMVWRSGTV